MFGAVIGNTDDHLRNHGYLRKNNSWQLAPAFDMNPEPFDPSLPDSHQMSLLGDTEVDIDKLMSDESLSLFGVSRKYADHWLPTLRSALSQALSRAAMRRIDMHSINLMAERFDKAVHALQ